MNKDDNQDDVAHDSNKSDNRVDTTVEDSVNDVIIGMRDHAYKWSATQCCFKWHLYLALSHALFVST